MKNRFVDKIKSLREMQKPYLRQVAEHLEMDNVLYFQIERGDRSVKREQVRSFAKLFKLDELELFNISGWLIKCPE